MKNSIICHIEGLEVTFPIRGGVWNRVIGKRKAVDGVSFDIYQGETLGLVGESGCGKTTLGRAIMRLVKPDSGRVIYDGINLYKAKGEQIEQLRRSVQIIFQNATESINPRQTIGTMLEEILRVRMHVPKKEMGKTILQLLESVGLPKNVMNRYPQELSGGQCQRAAIARALALKPSFLVCDEIVSALDVSIQSQILNLLMDLKQESGLTYLFISHDLHVVRHLCNRVVVMYLGKIVEIAETEELYESPLHPYTKALLSAALSFQIENSIILSGEVSLENEKLIGCKFYARCPFAKEACQKQEPCLKEYSEGHYAACHFIND